MKKSFAFATVVMFSISIAPVFAGINVPTELGLQAGPLLIEGDSDLKNAFVYGARFGTYIKADIAIELSILGGKSEIRGTDQEADLLLPTVEGLYYFGNDRLRPYLTAGAGVLESNRDRRSDQNQIDFVAVGGGGLKYYILPSFVARGDIRYILNTASGEGSNNALISGGLSWLYGGGIERKAPKKAKKAMKATPKPLAGEDSDHDGVPDDIDRCPETPANTKVNSVGCIIDTDHDGVSDDRDACPDSPYGVPVNDKGCPLTQ